MKIEFIFAAVIFVAVSKLCDGFIGTSWKVVRPSANAVGTKSALHIIIKQLYELPKEYLEKPPSSKELNVSNPDVAMQVNSDSFSATQVEASQTNSVSHDSGSTSLASTTKTAVESESSPVLGDLVADLGYKKVYLTSVSALSRIPVWKKQRILRRERLQMIAESMKRWSSPYLPGIITLYEDSTSGDVGIIDGQHRAGALRFLVDQGVWDQDAKNVVIEVFPISSEKNIATLFTAINAAEPVREIDLPFEDLTAEQQSEGIKSEATRAKVKSLIDEATEILREKYKEMFKTSSRCKRPHLNIDVLRSSLFGVDAVQEEKFATAAELVSHLESINTRLSTDFSKSGSGSELSDFDKKALQKATENKFYLGMKQDWLYDNSFWA